MRTVVLRSFGGPEVLEVTQTPRPEPGPGEVLLRVEAVGLNPVDALVRGGGRPQFGTPPIVLGWDVAGVVEQVGPGTDRFAPGDRAFGLSRFPQQARAYAEYVAAPAAHLAHVPQNLDAVHAAALPLAGLTAWQALVEAAGVTAGDHVLVHAAGGGVGHLAVQIARARGAVVTATASKDKADFVRELGAGTVIDYRTDDVTAAGRDLDAVLDAVGGDTAERSLPLLRPGGTLATILRHRDDALRATVEAAGRRFAGVMVRPDAVALEELAALVAEGRLRVHVERTYAFEELPEAHRRLEGSSGRGSGTGIRGKLVAVP